MTKKEVREVEDKLMYYHNKMIDFYNLKDEKNAVACFYGYLSLYGLMCGFGYEIENIVYTDADSYISEDGVWRKYIELKLKKLRG